MNEIKIDQDLLCEFCKSYNDSSMSMCEGSECEQMTEHYLEDVGVTETDLAKKTFEGLNIGNNIYHLSTSENIPNINIYKVNGVSIDKVKEVTISYKSGFVRIKEGDVDTYENVFIYKKDADEALEKECTERIIKLSKAIGSIIQ